LAGTVSLLPPEDAAAATWRFSEGAEFPGATGSVETTRNGTLDLRYDFRGGGNYVAASCDLDPPLTIARVSLRMRKPAEAEIAVRVTDSAGQTFQKGVLYSHDEWQRLSFDLRNWSAHWGGPDDGALRPPVTSIAILVENQHLKSSRGVVTIADVVAETASGEAIVSQDGPHAGEYQVTDFGNDAGFGALGRLEDGSWSVDFSKTGSAALSHSISLFGHPEALTLRVRGGLPGSTLTLHLGSHFQTFSKQLGVLDGGDRTFTVPTPPEGWDFGGGENDGKVRNPLRVSRLQWDRGDAEAKPAELQLVELRCKTEIAPDQAVTLVASMAGIDPANLTASCRAWNLLDHDVTGMLQATVSDWEGNVLHEYETYWTLFANGVPADQSMPVPVPDVLNFADVVFRFVAGAAVDASAHTTYTRPLADEGDATLQPASPWGMGVYLYRYGDNPDGHARMDRAAAMAQAAGVKWSREEFSWARTEPREGEYDFHFYDVVVDTAHRHGINVYGLLSYWSSWTEPYTEAGIDDFCRWAAETVTRYKDRIKHWEVYNEPNIFFWQGPKELYPVLLERCYAAIKAADPEAEVLGISTAGIDNKFIQLCLDAGASFDILTIHPYRAVMVEPGFIEQLRDTAGQVNGRPVWITEMGWSTQINGGKDERTQAQLLARSYLAAVASGVCQNISWYDFRNDGTDPFYNESNFGVLHADMTPKPAYRALATVCRTLDSGEPERVEEFGDDAIALRMGDALALWSPFKDILLRVKPEGDVFRITNLMGEELTPERDGKAVTLHLRPGAPLFLTGAAVQRVGKPEVVEAEDALRF